MASAARRVTAAPCRIFVRSSHIVIGLLSEKRPLVTLQYKKSSSILAAHVADIVDRVHNTATTIIWMDTNVYTWPEAKYQLWRRQIAMAWLNLSNWPKRHTVTWDSTFIVCACLSSLVLRRKNNARLYLGPNRCDLSAADKSKLAPSPSARPDRSPAEEVCQTARHAH